mgnify:CR=1 FL=1
METIALLVIATYSFLGIEQVSIELDNPFGTDPSDLPVEEMAMRLYDYIELILYACDGLEATKALRARLADAQQMEQQHTAWQDDKLTRLKIMCAYI